MNTVARSQKSLDVKKNLENIMLVLYLTKHFIHNFHAMLTS